MIAFGCNHCGKKLQVGETSAGKTAKCPGCTRVVTVPGTRQVLETIASGSTQLKQAAPAELFDFLEPPQSPKELGRLGQYRILKILGTGGMGVVYQAEDPQLSRSVALKAMLPVQAKSATSRQRFLREARTAAAIEHDHIIPIFQVGEDRGVPYLIMPLLKGEPLDGRLKRQKKFSVSEVLRIGREAAQGLAAAHARGLIHRDIKPANIWLETLPGEESTGRYRVKILDFGLARAADDDQQVTQEGAIVGTPAYMAPEQAGGLELDGRCDIFSLGCILYHLLTGELPFKGTDTISTLLAVATDHPKAPRQLDASIPPALSELVMRMLAKKPADRPASAQAVVSVLQAIEIDATVVMPPVVPAAIPLSRAPLWWTSFLAAVDRSLPPEFRARHWQGILLAAAGVALLFLLGGWAVFSSLSSGGRKKADPEDVPVIQAGSDEEWCKEVAALKPDKQLRAVLARMKERNPGFDGANWAGTINSGSGEVTGLKFSTAEVTDLSPLRALPSLNDLTCVPHAGQGKLSDLSPLRSLQLTELRCGKNQITDLSPLKKLPLTILDCSDSPLSNLSGLGGLPLKVLDCHNTQVTDLTPLKGMKLDKLNCSDTKVTDLGPLAGMPLTTLDIHGTPVSDLTQLKTLPQLSHLNCQGTNVSDLSPLKDVPLKTLLCDSKFVEKSDNLWGLTNAVKTLEMVNNKQVPRGNQQQWQQWGPWNQPGPPWQQRRGGRSN